MADALIERACDEAHRLDVLKSMKIMDSEPEIFFEDCVDNIRDILKTPVSVISLVDEERQWFKARRGLNVCSTARNLSFCAEAMMKADGVMINDVSKDEHFRRHPAIKEDPTIHAYLGVPIIVQHNVPLGAVAAVDFIPREWTRPQRQILKRMARQISVYIEARARLLTSGDTRQPGLRLVASN